VSLLTARLECGETRAEEWGQESREGDEETNGRGNGKEVTVRAGK